MPLLCFGFFGMTGAPGNTADWTVWKLARPQRNKKNGRRLLALGGLAPGALIANFRRPGSAGFPFGASAGADWYGGPRGALAALPRPDHPPRSEDTSADRHFGLGPDTWWAQNQR